MNAIDGVFHFGVIALAVDRYPLAKVAAANQRQHPVAFSDGHKDFVEHLIDALDDPAIVALMLGGIGACAQLTFRRGFDQPAGLSDQSLYIIDAIVQVVLDLVEVAVVVVGDPGRNVALGNPVNVLSGNIERADDRVQRGVYALDYFTVVALMLGGVGASGQLALDGGLRSTHWCRRPAR